MNTWHLRYFLTAARAGTLNAAAQRYRITHSAVSQSVRALERELGVELLKHRKRSFELSEGGRALLEMGGELLESLEQLPQRLQEREQVPSGPLRVAAPQSLLAGVLWEHVQRLRQRYPRLRLQLRTGASASVKEQVRNGTVQVGLLADDLYLAGFTQETLFEGDFVLVAAKPRVKPDKVGIIVTEAAKPEVLHLLGQADYPIALELLSWTLIRKALLEGAKEAGYLPDYLVREDLRTKQLYLCAQPGSRFRYQLKAIWPAGRSLARNAELFLAELRGRKVSKK